MRSTATTEIVGAGQAGLALSRCLTEEGIDHVLLERGRLGERWCSERWDSFRLLSPNRHTRLPGHRYGGPNPDGFMDAGFVRLLEGYAVVRRTRCCREVPRSAWTRSCETAWSRSDDRSM